MTPIQDAAVAYISQGLEVVPLEGKACIGSNWKDISFGPEDFRVQDNIGIKNGNGIIDIDLDCIEAIQAAPTFLPKTGAVYGRPAKPDSHYLYRGTLDKPYKFVDLIANTNLLEIRIDHQSMAPPSIHPDTQEELAWRAGTDHAALVIGDTDKPTIYRAGQLTSTASMVGRYYRGEGARHEWMLALAGTLRQFDIAEDEVANIVKVGATIAGDRKVADRLREVQTTFAKSDDDAVSGPKTLVSLMDTIGEKFVQTIRKIWGADASTVSKSKIDQLNETHAVIFQQSGDLVIITEDKDIDGRFFLRFSAPETFKQLYPEQVVVGVTARGTPIMKPLGAAWFTSPRRRFYGGIELSPNGSHTSGYYNMWRGFHFEPKKGDWSKFRAHIRNVICGGVEEHDAYMMAWLANCVQKPAYPGQIAVSLRGGQGTGKGFFLRNFGELFGVHYIQLDSTRHLTGNFNAHLHNAIFVFADEAAWPGNKAAVGALKRLITEPTLSIERKGMDIMSVPNRIHLAMASNEHWVIPAEIDERRFFVLDVPKTVVGNYQWFTELTHELQHGGYEAMLYDLLEYSSSVNILKPPDTEALKSQKILSYSPEQSWWYNLLIEHGDMWREKVKEREGDIRNGLFCILRAGIYQNYLDFMDTTQRSKPKKTMAGLHAIMTTFCPEGLPAEYRSRVGGKLSDRYWLFPPINDLRDFYDVLHKATHKTKWPSNEAELENPFLLDSM